MPCLFDSCTVCHTSRKELKPQLSAPSPREAFCSVGSAPVGRHPLSCPSLCLDQGHCHPGGSTVPGSWQIYSSNKPLLSYLKPLPYGTDADPMLPQPLTHIHPSLAILFLSMVATESLNHEGQNRCLLKSPGSRSGPTSCISCSSSEQLSCALPGSPASTGRVALTRGRDTHPCRECW